MSKINKIATSGIIIMVTLMTVFFSMYKEYEYTFTREERLRENTAMIEMEFRKAIYQSLKLEAQVKTDRVASDIRRELIKNYKDDLNKFKHEYEHPTVDSTLITTIDKIIHSEENRFFHIESDSNDMFVASKIGIVSDKSEDCSTFGITRTYKDEISMHYNKSLAKKAIDSLIVGNETDVFWRFRNTMSKGQNDTNIKEMDINMVLKLPLEELKDYEFLTYTYIDKYNDILGVTDVNAIGQKQDSKKLIVVQGFNLYDHIKANYSSSYKYIDSVMNNQLDIL